ncbi:sce7726 family protein [Pseudomonas aeruginosa]|uniref:sce7726 family protein n=1 Tax=Pseudomonas aeruginosa TaxID=287 RepID=UPI001A224E75|nr:sce7726 family protein [Pseudomonas aeruginosa]MBI7354311.1 sce7726 family protein [Pseudomonas aeruginosa]MBI8948666.1 sce7726 family protein [Pseudomonas aeruginosa]MDU0538046.1 sce7726 family protein [Pseudomonas aeruginosa]HEJ4043556.1 sce7726 family protein [Pseudomonas aeruginosa]HEJ5767233.1 sce7726 family protein [Pseudomonas aeruginosa]
MSLVSSAETKLKAAVVDRLFSSGVLDEDAVLVTELTVDNWAHRTDIVLANGRLWGFELKSERDTLTRLPAQIESFSKHFEKFVLVVDEKFEAQAELLIRSVSGAGLWISREKGKLTEKIRPRAAPLAKKNSISLMTVSELRKLLSECGHHGLKGKRRSELVDIAENLSPKTLADGAREAIKARFKRVHQRFLLQREAIGSLKALPLLTRTTGKTMPVEHAHKINNMSFCPPIPLSHPNLIQTPSGPVIARLKR